MKNKKSYNENYTYLKPSKNSKLDPNVFYFRKPKEVPKSEIIKKVFKK